MIRPRPFAQQQPGELVTASVRNPLEDPHSLGKIRPVVLVRRNGPSWLVIGLTSKAHYRTTGGQRTPVPNPWRVGLHGPKSFLWSGRLTAINVLDVADHVGWVDHALADAVAELAKLSSSDAMNLMNAAQMHHGAADLKGRKPV